MLTQGEDYYINEEGNLVFTEKYHLKRGIAAKVGASTAHTVSGNRMETKKRKLLNESK